MFPFILTVVAVFLVQVQAGSLPEGASCSDNGVQGTCRKAQACPSYSVLRTYHQEQQVTTCSGDGKDAVVCCTDCQLDDASNVAVTPDGIIWKTRGIRKTYDKCVDYAASLPYPCKNGKKVTPKKVYDADKKCHRLDVNVEHDDTAVSERIDFPNLALLGYAANETVNPQWHCQGFIISERFILTTAHCGKDLNQGAVRFVAVGVDKRVESSPPVPAPASWQLYRVRSFLQHPGWRAPAKYNDIALLETDTEIKFGRNVLPVCLSEQPAVPETVNADVFGLEGTRDNQKVTLKKLDEKQCSALFQPSRHLKNGIDFETQACFGGFGETKQTCGGSSGRPIYTQGEGELTCAAHVVGFVSFGQSCAHADASSVYTRLHNYLPWIESVVWP